MSELDPDQEKIHEGTEALREIAEEVEREREETGRSDLDGPQKPNERMMSDAAALFEDNPDVEADTREDH
ncbi:MAG: hypothetical protein CVT68_03410 [Actinobacteria bacterium HGW-Actinobacteria-8]|nr:MAG: hypothetical protein CVT68_03410 [Actinobacteria bacterium HGW-Actinobacteria-8]